MCCSVDAAANDPKSKEEAQPDNQKIPETSKKRAGGLNAVLGFINKKQKISTLVRPAM